MTTSGASDGLAVNSQSSTYSRKDDEQVTKVGFSVRQTMRKEPEEDEDDGEDRESDGYAEDRSLVIVDNRKRRRVRRGRSRRRRLRG